jgi:hypothetical protein
VKAWLVAWGPAAAWAAVLFYLSSQPTLPVHVGSGIDKVLHFAAYLVLGGLAAWGAARSAAIPAVAIFLSAFYGMLDEYHQTFVPGRSAEVADWIADFLGTVAGVLLFHYLRAARSEVAEDPGPAIETTPT